MAKNNYMLITVVERSICTEQFPTFEQARATMLKELGEDVMRHTDNTQNEWDEVCQQNLEYGTDEYEFGNSSAWSNLDDENKKDWLIVGLDN